MIADVRMKVSMRLAALVDSLMARLRTSEPERLLVMSAQTQSDVAAMVRAKYRADVVRSFPGCQITFTRQHISVKLPDRYARSQNPILHPVPPALVEAFNPRGYVESKQEG